MLTEPPSGPPGYGTRMCGRYATALSEAEWNGIFPVLPENMLFPEPRYNLAPTQGAPVIRLQGSTWELAVLRWGLVPGGARDPASLRHTLFNARSETAAEKPSFRAAFRARRCLMPASGFYEWRAEGDGRQPYFFTRRDGKPVVFAGLWEHWEGDGRTLESCTMLTTAANGFMGDYHHRMPVILEEEQRSVWLEDGPQELLGPAGEDVLQAWAVSRAAGNIRNEGPGLTEPVAEQGRLV